MSDEIKRELEDLLHQHSIANKGLGRIIQHNSKNTDCQDENIVVNGDGVDNDALEMFQLEAEFQYHSEQVEKAILLILEDISL